MFIDEWKLISEAYKGLGGFNDGTYILKYPRETEDKLKERQKIAYYPKLIAKNINKYIGYLYKKTPLRSTNNDYFKIIIDDVDRQGNSMDIFMLSFSLQAKLKGCNLVLVDNVSQFTSTNSAQQKQNRELPYLKEVAPESIAKYKKDKFGGFEYIAFYDTLDNSTYETNDVTEIIRYYDCSYWKVFNNEGAIIQQGEHNLGVCPVLYLSEDNQFPTVGEFTQLGSIAKRYYNLLSEEDELLRTQTFSILAIQAKEKKPDLSLGTNNALIYDGDKEPSFITPSNTPTDAYSNKILKIEQTIDDITYNFTTNTIAESGIALDMKFQGLNGSLSSFSARCEDFERKVFYIIALYLGIKSDVEIKYTKEFNIIDILKEIEKLASMDTVADLPKYKEKKIEQIIKNDISGISEDEVNEILGQFADNFKKTQEENNN